MDLFLKSLFLMLILFFPLEIKVALASSSLEDLISRVQESYDELSDFSASFKQETTIQDFKTPIISKGELFIKKRDKMKLDYRQPKKEEIFINGHEMTTFIPDQHQAIKGLFSREQESKLPVRLLAGEANLNKEFDIRKDPDKNAPSSFYLILIPRQKDENLDKIEVEVAASTYLIKSLHLYQVNHNSSSFIFSNIHTNTGLKDSFFNFIVPEGTEVIHPFPSDLSH